MLRHYSVPNPKRAGSKNAYLPISCLSVKGYLFLLDGIGVLVIGFRHALPLAVHLQQKQHIGKVDTVAPAFLQNAHHSQRFLYQQHIHTGLEIVAAGYGVHVVIELLDGAMLQLAVKVAEQNRLVNKQFLRVLAVALGHALDKLHCRFFYGLVFFDFRSHGDFLLKNCMMIYIKRFALYLD